jgi:ATP-dependent metalloprotease
MQLTVVTTGASSDLQHATSTARRMVTQYGFSDKAGLTQISSSDWEAVSSETKAIVESEVSRLLSESYARTTKLLKSKENELHILAKALVECLLHFDCR